MNIVECLEFFILKYEILLNVTENAWFAHPLDFVKENLSRDAHKLYQVVARETETLLKAGRLLFQISALGTIARFDAEWPSRNSCFVWWTRRTSSCITVEYSRFILFLCIETRKFMHLGYIEPI
jgi:hypothetical protein